MRSRTYVHRQTQFHPYEQKGEKSLYSRGLSDENNYYPKVFPVLNQFLLMKMFD